MNLSLAPNPFWLVWSVGFSIFNIELKVKFIIILAERISVGSPVKVRVIVHVTNYFTSEEE